MAAALKLQISGLCEPYTLDAGRARFAALILDTKSSMVDACVARRAHELGEMLGKGSIVVPGFEDLPFLLRSLKDQQTGNPAGALGDSVVKNVNDVCEVLSFSPGFICATECDVAAFASKLGIGTDSELEELLFKVCRL